jgi:hypothetical protein
LEALKSRLDLFLVPGLDDSIDSEFEKFRPKQNTIEMSHRTKFSYKDAYGRKLTPLY